MCKKPDVVATFMLLAVASPVWGAPEPIVTTDLLRLRIATSIDVAADGSKAVFAVRSIEALPPQEGDEDRAGYAYRSHLYQLDLRDPGSAPRRLTFGDRRDHDPRLSPDGRRVAFVRTTGDQDNGEAQVWVMRVDGGEARPVTSLEHGAWEPRWSPDGTHLLVRSSLPIDEIVGVPPYPCERPGRGWKDAAGKTGAAPRPAGTRAEIRAWLAASARAQDPTVIARLDFQEETELRGPTEFEHLFLVDPDESPPLATRLTDGFFDCGSAVFMPDGGSVVYTSKKVTEQHPDRVRGTDLWRVGADGSDDRLLLSVEGWSLSHPEPSADGSVIAFLGRQLDEPAFRQWRLGVAPAEGGSPPFWLTGPETLDASVWDFEWDRTRSALLFTTAMRGAFPLLTISRGLLEPAVLIDRYENQPAGVHAFGVGGAVVVYAITTPRYPCLLLVTDARGERVAYDLNPWVADKKLSMPAEGWVSRPDGTSVQYWLMEPTHRQAKARYPLAVQIHGGPSVMWGPGELTMWHEFQLLCSWGYGVVYANPRGSGGYGYEFQRANFQDWGQGPAGDVLAVVDQVALNDWIDEDRLVVTGGSYAGYLTAWIVAHDHRFRAAVAQRGVYDLETFFGEGNAWRLVEWSMGGFPHEARYRAVIDRNSPFTYVNRIRTPLLIMHADLDLRAGVSQSQMLYRALKHLGRPVEYVRYPNAGHDLSRNGDPHQRMDRLNRIIEFFERYVENPRPSPMVKTAD